MEIIKYPCIFDKSYDDKVANIIQDIGTEKFKELENTDFEERIAIIGEDVNLSKFMDNIQSLIGIYLGKIASIDTILSYINSFIQRKEDIKNIAYVIITSPEYMEYRKNLLKKLTLSIYNKSTSINLVELRNRTISVVNNYDNNYSQVNSIYLQKSSLDKLVELKLDNKSKLEKFITFIMPVKNRSERARYSIESVVNEYNHQFCNFIIVEDKGKDNINLDGYVYKHCIDHYVVDTTIAWTRGGLLNFGVKRATTPLVLFWDADFLFPDTFVERLRYVCSRIDFDKYVFAINCFETHDNSRSGSYYGAGFPYGYTWVYKTDILKDIRGFNEKMIYHGFEERDLHKRLELKYSINILYSAYLFRDLMVIHYSHNDNLRGKLNTIYNKQISVDCIKRGKLVANSNNWGEYKYVYQSYKSNV